MSFIDIETSLLSLDEQRGVVIADPAYYVAIKQAYVSARALRQWNFNEPPPALSPEGQSVTLIASWKRINHTLIQLLRSSLLISGKRRRNFGLITGLSLEMLEEFATRSTIPPSTDLAPGWILADAKLLSNIRCSSRQLLAGDLMPATLPHAIKPIADFGVLVGHGREDICYFSSFAVCGQSSLTNAVRPCHPDQCPYKLPKIYADKVTARIIVLLSCSAGKIGNGLFPSVCRLSLSSLSGGTTVCLAAHSLFTLTPGLVEYIMSLLEEGVSVGEVARLAGEWHEIATGEPDPFIVFGDPDVAPYRKAINKSSLVSQHWSLANTDSLKKIENISDRLANIYEGLETLKILELLPKIGFSLKLLIDEKEKTLTHLISIAKSNERARQHLESIWSKIELISQEVESTLIHQLVEKSLDDYFWLTSQYTHYVMIERRELACILCSSPAVQERFNHPFRSLNSRVRLTCSRCGIIQDYPINGSRIYINSVNIQNEKDEFQAFLEMEIDSVNMIGLLNVAINKGRKLLDKSELIVSVEPEKHFDLPCRVVPSGREQIRLHIRAITQGVYFAKVFWIEDLQLTVASAPISVLNSL
jgi:hypothetical protein